MNLIFHPTLTFFDAPLAFKGEFVGSVHNRGRRFHTDYFIRLQGRRIAREGDRMYWAKGHSDRDYHHFDLYSWWVEAVLPCGSIPTTKVGPASLERGIAMTESFVFKSLDSTLEEAYQILVEDGHPAQAWDVKYLMDLIGYGNDHLETLRGSYVVSRAIAIAKGYEDQTCL